MNAVEATNESLGSWLENAKTKKYFYIILLLEFLTLSLFLVAYWQFAGEDFFTNAYLPDGSGTALGEQALQAELALAPVMIVYSFAVVYLYFLIIIEALRQFGFKAEELTLKKTIHGYMLMALWLFAAALSWHDKKLLAIPVAIAALIILDQVLAGSPELLMLSGILTIALIIAYALAVFRNALRLLLSYPVFFSGKKTPGESLAQSWGMTRGKTLQIAMPFLMLLVVKILPEWTLVYAGAELGKFLGISTGFTALAVILQSIPARIMSSLYAVWSNYYMVIAFRELGEKE